LQARLKISRDSFFFRMLTRRWARALVVAALLLFATAGTVFTYYYVKYSRLIDASLRTGPFSHTSMLYASPRPVMVGDETRIEEIASYLRKCGYSESNSSRVGWYRVRPDAIEINPGPDAYDSEGAVVKIAGGRVTQIISQTDNTVRQRYFLEPEQITNLFDKSRVKRRVVRYDDIPAVMRDAVLAAEDKHFFQHSGFDPIGIIRATWRDLWGKRLEGASTITQQLARVPLGNERGWRRKIPETFITLHLEGTLTKNQIFEDYANSIYLGNQGSFRINGFAQAAQSYLGKDLSRVTAGDAAFLAGLIQGPALYDPFRHKDKALARRNIVLKAMLDDEKITEKQYAQAVASPLAVTREEVDSTDAPYFVDLVNEKLLSTFQDRDFQTNSYNVYTTLNMELQHDAIAAVKAGIVETDQQWHRRSKKYGTAGFPQAQVALIALDAETGAVLALTGGRRYGELGGQIDRALAERQPGSSFKPIVYATAMATALDSGAHTVLTPASIVVDEPTIFFFEQQPPYEPKDFDKEPPRGPVTIREALAHSLNIPAVKVAEMVGYGRVADTAKAMGLNINIKPTPSIALGAYEVTPLEIAGAYTAFVNGGDVLKTTTIKTIRDQTGASIFESKLERRHAIDPRVAYLVENMMEEVLRSGTGARARSLGFTLPAAGKTGTSRDGWFVGFTSKIICAVWVGFDDNRDFKLEGAHSALPIWVDFMKRAHQHREYRNVHAFEPPEGIVTAEIDADTGELASPACPKVRSEVFIAGSQPVTICHVHGSGKTQISTWEPVQTAPAVGSAETPVVAAAQPVKPGVRSIPITPAKAPPPPEPEKKKEPWWKRIMR
jgi:penicillin-binding protein 1B